MDDAFLEASPQWRKLRLERAEKQDLHCVRVYFSEDSAIFEIDGVTDRYEVEINQNSNLWDVGVSPTCTCEDHMWRSCICKHIIFCLKLMGCTDDFLLSDCCWEGPDQVELYELLSNAPGCVGCRNFSPSDVNNTFLPQKQDG